MTIGGGVSKRLSSLFSASLTLQGSLLSGAVVSDESTVLSINDSPVPATIRHTIDLSLYAISIEPSLRFCLDPIRLRIAVPFFVLLNGSYVATQQVTNPPGVYLGGQDVRVEGEGTLPGLQRFVPALSLSFGTVGKVVGTVRIEPEVTIGVPLASITSAADWKIWTIGAGIRLAPSYDKIRALRRDTSWIRDTSVLETIVAAVGSTSTSIRVVDSVDDVGADVIVRHLVLGETTTITVPRERPFLRAEARAMFIDDRGLERDRIAIRTKKFDNEFLMPLVSSVFFSPRSSELTSYDGREISLPNAWDTTSFCRIVAKMQFRLLDDWAREIDRTSGKVGVRGRASTSENPSLADERSAAVVDYLVKRGVSRGRLRILESEILDDSASHARTVAIDVGKAKPALQRESWSTIQPEECNIRIHLRSVGDAPVRSWEVTFSNQSRTITALRGEGELPEHVLFKVPDSILVAMESGSEFTYRVRVQSNDSIVFTSEPARISMQRSPDDGSVRTKRNMAMPTMEIAESHQAALYTLQWKSPSVRRLSTEEVDVLHQYGATWGRLINGMVFVRSD